MQNSFNDKHTNKAVDILKMLTAFSFSPLANALGNLYPKGSGDFHFIEGKCPRLILATVTP